MFTGLVQAIGTLRRAGSTLQISWQPGAGLSQPLALGDSVAVDGVCLTVASLQGHGFSADVSRETLQRTTLAAKAERAEPVNLEPALRLADRLGGHLVSGHIDGTGQVAAIEQQEHAWRLALSWHEPRFGRYICEKASVAVNGISLTVAGCAPEGQHFWIAVIPHTWTNTTLQHLRSGAVVNLEADLLAKYAERLLAPEPSKPGPEIDNSWLREHGWS
jgi:riboflavin synthase